MDRSKLVNVPYSLILFSAFSYIYCKKIIAKQYIIMNSIWLCYIIPSICLFLCSLVFCDMWKRHPDQKCKLHCWGWQNSRQQLLQYPLQTWRKQTLPRTTLWRNVDSWRLVRRSKHHISIATCDIKQCTCVL